MAHSIAILSVIPRLSYHIRSRLPHAKISDVSPDRDDTLVELNKADVLVADCDLLIPYANELSVKWVQSTWAGVEKLAVNLKKEKVNYVLTRFSDESFGYAMSEYVMAQIFNLERDQRRQYENQRKCLWEKEGKIGCHRLIRDMTVGVLGLGNIGKHIAQRLKLFGAEVWGVTRSSLKEELGYVDQHRTIEFLPEVLKNCDYIVNVLPATQDTIGLLNGNVLENCVDRQTVFVNIGRGSIIKESDLINAIERKWISAAILDVFEQEPLSKDSKLWKMPEVTISPHISGVSRPQDIAKLFAENYDRFVNGKTLPHVFNWQQGY